jgi:hypothetical protein
MNESSNRKRMKQGKEKMTENSNKGNEFSAKPEEEEKLFRTKYPPAQNLKVPSGYFEKLPYVMQDRIAAEDQKPLSTWFNRASQRYQSLVMPVSIAALLIISLIVFLPGRKSQTQSALNSIDSSAYSLGYDESYAHEAIAIESVDLNNEIDSLEDDLGEALSRPAMNDSSLSDDDIIEYLNQQDIDPELLAEL